MLPSSALLTADSLLLAQVFPKIKLTATTEICHFIFGAAFVVVPQKVFVDGIKNTAANETETVNQQTE